MNLSSTIDGTPASAMFDIVSALAGSEISALALVCAVGEASGANVLAFITPAGVPDPSFRHAVDLEGAYTGALLRFDDCAPPYYGRTGGAIDLKTAASAIGVDRVLCLVTQGPDGRVAVVRDYDGLEFTLLEAANEQFARFAGVLEGMVGRACARLQ